MTDCDVKYCHTLKESSTKKCKCNHYLHVYRYLWVIFFPMPNISGPSQLWSRVSKREKGEKHRKAHPALSKSPEAQGAHFDLKKDTVYVFLNPKSSLWGFAWALSALPASSLFGRVLQNLTRLSICVAHCRWTVFRKPSIIQMESFWNKTTVYEPIQPM